MKQNKYDDPEFFLNYDQLPRSQGGLDAASEWPAFRSLLPDLVGKRVLDLGCGFGWHCRYARRMQAVSVTGVDISERMLERARADTDDDGITYLRCAIEDFDFPAGTFDVAISSLALHYVERFDQVCRRVSGSLSAGGAFVFSVEHPLYTARAEQDWCLGPQGERLHWPVDDYQQEGPRHTSWLAADVVKYHRTMASYVNTLTDAGFRIARLLEPEPSPEILAVNPGWLDDYRRPMFLLIGATKDIVRTDG